MHQVIRKNRAEHDMALSNWVAVHPITIRFLTRNPGWWFWKQRIETLNEFLHEFYKSLETGLEGGKVRGVTG